MLSKYGIDSSYRPAISILIIECGIANPSYCKVRLMFCHGVGNWCSYIDWHRMGYTIA